MQTAITRWHFVRHAPVAGATSVFYATADEPADCSDAASFAALAAFLPARALLLTSGLKRTEATADAIVAAGWSGAAHRHVEPRLAEQHFGDWHGLDADAMASARGNGARHNHWFVTADDHPQAGESFRMVAARVGDALAHWSAGAAGANIVAVAHGGTIRAALAHALGLDLDRALSISVDNLSTTRIDYVPGPGVGGDWRVVYVNRRPR